MKTITFKLGKTELVMDCREGVTSDELLKIAKLINHLKNSLKENNIPKEAQFKNMIIKL